MLVINVLKKIKILSVLLLILCFGKISNARDIVFVDAGLDNTTINARGTG